MKFRVSPMLGLVMYQEFSKKEGGSVAGDASSTFATLREYVRVVYGAVFLSLVEDLEALNLLGREETPSLSECFRMVAIGELALRDGRGRALVAGAFFKQCRQLAGIPE